jgi:hypothetical protein
MPKQKVVTEPDMAGRDEREVALELFLLMHRNLVSNAIGQSVLSGLVFWAALGVTPTKTLLIWLAYMYVIAGLYIWQYFEYRDVAQKAVQQTGNLGHWKLYRNLVQWFSDGPRRNHPQCLTHDSIDRSDGASGYVKRLE